MNPSLYIEIQPLGAELYQIRAVDRPERPWHRATFAPFGEHALSTRGGNPDRAIQPIDPLWWLSFWEVEAPKTLVIKATLITR